MNILPILIFTMVGLLIEFTYVSSVQNSVRAMNLVLDERHQVDVMVATIKRTLTNSRSCVSTFQGIDPRLPSGTQVESIKSKNIDDSTTSKIYSLEDRPFKNTNSVLSGTVKLTKISLGGYESDTNTGLIFLVFDRSDGTSLRSIIPINIELIGGVVSKCRYGDAVTSKSVCDLLGGIISNGNCINLKIDGNLTAIRDIMTKNLIVSGVIDANSKFDVSGNFYTQKYFKVGDATIVDSITNADTLNAATQVRVLGSVIANKICIGQSADADVCPDFVEKNCPANSFVAGLKPNGDLVCEAW